MYSLIHLLHSGPSRNDVINSELYCFGPAYRLDSDSFPVYAFCFLILDAGFLPCQKKKKFCRVLHVSMVLHSIRYLRAFVEWTKEIPISEEQSQMVSSFFFPKIQGLWFWIPEMEWQMLSEVAWSL